MSLCLVWNYPVWAWSYQRWRYAREEDNRRWFCRIRLGWLKVEVSGWWGFA